MDPKDLPEQLQPLMEWIAEDISTRECEELAAALYENRDVFSSGSEDMGQMCLITHSIDAGEHRQLSQYFSTLDLYSGYWQVKMDLKNIDKTAFVMRQGLFLFTVMPFGLCSALATFERPMELVLSGLNWKICLIYLDDVIVCGGNIYDAPRRLKTV